MNLQPKLLGDDPLRKHVYEAEDAEALKEMLTESGNFGPLVLAPLKRIRIKEADAGGGKRPDGVAQANFPET